MMISMVRLLYNSRPTKFKLKWRASRDVHKLHNSHPEYWACRWPSNALYCVLPAKWMAGSYYYPSSMHGHWPAPQESHTPHQRYVGIMWLTRTPTIIRNVKPNTWPNQWNKRWVYSCYWNRLVSYLQDKEGSYAHTLLKTIISIPYAEVIIVSSCICRRPNTNTYIGCLEGVHLHN